ncbi:MAG: flagellin, partial [Chloroflexi bacterium]|nr:flagellin [Chloroflexota bacterium]
MADQGPQLSGQRGITGLETAIILIAFVVVASVFAFTVLSTGIFASERSKETVFSGILEARSTLEPRG